MEYFETELSELKKKLLTMAGYAETAVNRSIQSLTERDPQLAQQVRTDDTLIDQLEIEVDELAIHLLSKAPLASDLRFVMVAMKISQNLERIGDEASKIAKSARKLTTQEQPLKLNPELPQMAVKALDMLKIALSAFVERDSAKARSVIPRDKEVDALNKKLNNELTEQMMEHREEIPSSLKLMIATRSLERIADHAKNIAEEIVYLCDAEDIRHGGPKA